MRPNPSQERCRGTVRGRRCGTGTAAADELVYPDGLGYAAGTAASTEEVMPPPGSRTEVRDAESTNVGRHVAAGGLLEASWTGTLRISSVRPSD